MIDCEKVISDQLLKENESHDRKRQAGEYYCTDLGNCIRKTWYKYQDLDMVEQSKQETVRMLKVFERGNLLHEWLTARIRKHVDEVGGILKDEVSVVIPNMDDQFVIRGRIDNLIATKEGYEIIEVKTTARIRKTGMPLPHHVAQVMPYLLYAPNAKAGILYVEPNTLYTSFYEVKYDMFVMQELWKKSKDLHHCITNNILPDAEAKLKKVENWQCKYCDFKELCDMQDDVGKPMDFIPINGCKDDTDPEELVSFADEVEQLEKDLLPKETDEQKWQRLKKIMDNAEDDGVKYDDE